MLDLHAASWVAPDRYEIRGDAGRFEMWERDAAAQVGLGVAVEHALGWGIEAIAERNTALAAGLRERLAEIPAVTVRDRGEQLCAITTFTVDGIEPEEVQTRLRAEGVNVSVSTLDSAQLDLSTPRSRERGAGLRPLRDDRRRARPLRERAAVADQPLTQRPAMAPMCSWFVPQQPPSTLMLGKRSCGDRRSAPPGRRDRRHRAPRPRRARRGSPWRRWRGCRRGAAVHDAAGSRTSAKCVGWAQFTM